MLPIPPMVLRVMRVFRILRVLRLLKGPRAKGIRQLVMTLVLSFPSLVNVASLLALISFIYAVLGVVLFTFLKQVRLVLGLGLGLGLGSGLGLGLA